MTAINFPSSPVNGDTLTSGNTTYTYNAAKTRWDAVTTVNGIQLNSLSVGAEAPASGDGGIAYNNTSGVFTYTPPVSADPLPSQTGNTGKYLTTDGSTTSWAEVASGGGLSFIQDFTASGSITANTPVVLNSTGTVSTLGVVGEGSTAVNYGFQYSEVDGSSGNGLSYSAATDQFIAYQYPGKLKVGKFTSFPEGGIQWGDTITLSTQGLSGNFATWRGRSVYDSTLDRDLTVVYRADNDKIGFYQGSTSLGTYNYSAGTYTEFPQNHSSSFSQWGQQFAPVSVGAGKVLFMYRAQYSNNPTINIATTSLNQPFTFGSSVTLSGQAYANKTTCGLAYSETAGVAYALYVDGSNLKYAIINITGSSPVIESTHMVQAGIAYPSYFGGIAIKDNYVVVTYVDVQAGANIAKVVGGYIDSATKQITLGIAQGVSTSDTDRGGLTVVPTKFNNFAVLRTENNTYTLSNYSVATDGGLTNIQSTTVTTDSTYAVEAGQYNLVFSPISNNLVVDFFTQAGTSYGITGNRNYQFTHRAETLGPVVSNADRFLGFATTSVADAATVPVTLVGVQGGLSGLTPATDYYVTGTGSLSSGDTGYRKVGTALSSSSILMDDSSNVIGYATTSYVDTAITNLVDSSPAALNTLNELAAALGDDANFSTTVTNTLAEKADDAATTSALATKAPLASPTFTGVPVAPTATAGTNTTQIATTAFVTAATANAGGSSDELEFTANGAVTAGKLVVLDAAGTVSQVTASEAGLPQIPYTDLAAGTAGEHVLLWDDYNEELLYIANVANRYNIDITTQSVSKLSQSSWSFDVVGSHPQALMIPDTGYFIARGASALILGKNFGGAVSIAASVSISSVLQWRYKLSDIHIFPNGEAYLFGSEYISFSEGQPLLSAWKINYDTVANTISLGARQDSTINISALSPYTSFLNIITDKNNNAFSIYYSGGALYVSPISEAGGAISWGAEKTISVTSSPQYEPYSNSPTSHEKVKYSAHTDRFYLPFKYGATHVGCWVFSLSADGTGILKNSILLSGMPGANEYEAVTIGVSQTTENVGFIINTRTGSPGQNWGNHFGSINADGVYTSSEVYTGTGGNSAGNSYDNPYLSSVDIGGAVVFGMKRSDSITQYSLTLHVARMSTTTNAQNWIGIASDTVSDGSAVNVHLSTGLSNEHTGLSVGSRYYAAADGGLTTTPSLGYGLVGEALSSTTLQIVSESDLSGYATLLNATLVGTPTAPTATAGNASTQIATTAFVAAATAAAAGDTLPAQTDNAGKYLTTDGSTTSWATVSAGAGYEIGGGLELNSVTTIDWSTLPSPLTEINGIASEQYFGGIGLSASDTHIVIGTPGGAGAVTAFDVYSAETGAFLRSIEKIDPAALGDGGFGAFVSISGTKVIMGHPLAASVAGAAYIFEATTGALLHTLPAPTGGAATTGQAVAISPNYAAVLSLTSAQTSSRIGVYNVSTGALLHTIAQVTNGNGHGSLSITDQYLVAGEPLRDRDGQPTSDNSGAVSVYDTATGSLLHTIVEPTPSVSGDFGFSVSVHGDYIAIGGAPGTYGAVYVYSASTGSLLHTFQNPLPAETGTTYTYGFGKSISVYGGYLLVGALDGPKPGTIGDSWGRAYLYDLTNGILIQTISGTNNNDQLGDSVAIGPGIIAIGVPQYDSNGLTNNGKAVIYKTDVTTADYLQPDSTIATTSSPTFTGVTTLTATSEVLQPKFSAGFGAVDHDIANGSIFYHDNMMGNFDAAFINVPTTVDLVTSAVLVMADGQMWGPSSYVRVNGTEYVVKWLGGTAPTMSADVVDVVSYSLINRNGTWVVIGSHSAYSAAV